MADFLMPSLGADMESGTLLEWYVKPGDPVKRGDIVALVDTSKAEIEVEIFEDGVIEELLVGEGERVPVGTPLARVDSAAMSAAAAVPDAPLVSEPPQAPPAQAPPPERAPAPPEIAQPHRHRASPIARRTAAEQGIDLERVTGTGPGGVIRKADVERAMATTAPAAPSPTGPPQATSPPTSIAAAASPAADRQLAMRQAIAALMARSKREIPHYYLQLDIDVSRVLEWVRAENLRRPVQERLLPSVLLLSASAKAVAETPELNGFWLDGAFQPASAVHLGVAVSLRGGGLVAPALHNADRISLDEVMAGVRDLVGRARSGRLRSSEMSDPTITVTNLGDRGVDLVHGVIYPPQVALVGFGAIRPRPWAADGMLGVRATVTATLAADHRASDGHAGGRLLRMIQRRLENPEEL